MAIDNLSSFKKMLSDENNEDLKFKAQEIAAQYIGEAAQRGVQMTLDDAYSLSAVRLHVLTGERITDDWWSEAEGTLNSFQKARADRQIMEAINDENGDLKRKADAEAALQAELDALSPIERMKRARELGQRLTGPGETKRQPLSPAEKAAALQELERLPAAMKMARVRELGL